MRLPKTVPELTKVKSSNVEAIGYDPRGKYLYVRFLPDDDEHYGPVYRYENVDRPIYDRFLSAPSKGMFVWAELKGKYNYAKWTGFGWKKAPALQRRSAQKKRIKQRIRTRRRR